MHQIWGLFMLRLQDLCVWVVVGGGRRRDVMCRVACNRCLTQLSKNAQLCHVPVDTVFTRPPPCLSLLPLLLHVAVAASTSCPSCCCCCCCFCSPSVNEPFEVIVTKTSQDAPWRAIKLVSFWSTLFGLKFLPSCRYHVT